jgi:hypothetical protein
MAQSGVSVGVGDPLAENYVPGPCEQYVPGPGLAAR